eukprot:m.305691 g.305691  ORF g.305691 m.305691 type:complete len:635 (+) comp20187_c0_seq2:373-2277(+)
MAAQDSPANAGSRPRRFLAIFTGTALFAGIVAAIVFFLRYYGSDWSVAGTSFSNWVAVLFASTVAWVPASAIRKIFLGTIRVLHCVYDPGAWRRGKTKVLYKSMNWVTTFFIWSILEFLVTSLVFQWNPFPLDDDTGDIHDNSTLALINVILVIAALLLVAKQYFLVTKVKLAKRTEYVETKAREALSWERALNIIASDLNPACFRKKHVEKLKFSDVSIPRRTSVDAGSDNHFSVAQLFLGTPTRRRGHAPPNENDNTNVRIDVDNAGGMFRRHTSATRHAAEVESNGDGSGRGLGTSVVPASVTAMGGGSRIQTDEDTDAVEDSADIYHELEYLRTHYVSCCDEQVVIGTKADGRKLALLLMILLTKSGCPPTDKKTGKRHGGSKARTQDNRIHSPSELEKSEVPVEGEIESESDETEAPVDGKDTTENAHHSTPPSPLAEPLDSPLKKDGSSVAVDVLMRRCHHDKDVESFVKEVLGCVSEISTRRLKSGIEVVRKHRQHLRQSLEDLDSTVKAVDTFLAVFIGIVILLLLLIIFSQGDFAEVTVTTSTSIFALSFIFAETAKNLFNSFVFLFLRHPFDVGDRVHIDANASEPYYVLKMELLTTTFTMWSGVYAVGLTLVANMLRDMPLPL